MSDRCCKCCLSFIFTLGLTAFFLWLTFRPYKPTCSIEKFYLPALDRSLDSAANVTIFMDLRLKNGNREKGIKYDPINVKVSYFNHSPPSVWQGRIPGFYQGHQKKATKNVTVVTAGVNWADVAARNESALFGVDLQTQVRSKIIFWKTKRHKLAVTANVTVNKSGAKSVKHGIKLKSDAVEIGINSRKVGIFLGLLAFWLLNSL